MEFVHLPVLLNETITSLNIHPDGYYLDATAGGGGHSAAIADSLGSNGMLIAIDRDPDAIIAVTSRLSRFKDHGIDVRVLNGNYDDLDNALIDMKMSAQNVLDGVLMDLGVSSYQLDQPERGFSYHNDAPLDMRMSKEGISAADVVNTYSREELVRILFQYGEEKFAKKIADYILSAREISPILTTGQLADIIKKAYPAAKKREKNPCKKTFQAIRIEVNHEFDHLVQALNKAFEALKPGGRLAVITFHSIEDRIVKQSFNKFCQGCECPPSFPICICNKTPRATFINKKPIIASSDEQEGNRRSRSAKLRVIEKNA